MPTALLQCYSDTYCSFPSILRCLKRFVHGYDSEDKLTSIITGHLLPSESRPELPGTTSLTPPCPALTAASGGNPYVNGSSIVRPLRLSHRSNFHGRMQILPSGNPSKSWAALLDFFHALQGNVTNWIRKMERNGMTTLAAHLTNEDFISTFEALKRSFDIPTDREDVVFFQRNLLQWHKNVQQRISPFSNDSEEATGESLLNRMREEQDIMRGEALKLQGRAETSRP